MQTSGKIPPLSTAPLEQSARALPNKLSKIKIFSELLQGGPEFGRRPRVTAELAKKVHLEAATVPPHAGPAAPVDPRQDFQHRPSGSEHHPSESDLALAAEAPLPGYVDPLTLALASPPPVGSQTQAGGVTPQADFAAAVDELVRRIAWGGDRHSGTARIELGSGRYRGGAILVRAEGRSVSVELDLPEGGDAAALGQRLRERLEQKGLEVSHLEVR